MKKYSSLKKYFSFDGRAKRSEYWAIVFINFILAVVASLFAEVAFLIYCLIAIITMWLGIATTVRRLRDAGINIWFLLLGIVPLINLIAFIYWGCVDSKK